MFKYCLLFLLICSSLVAQDNTSIYVAFGGRALLFNTNLVAYKIPGAVTIFWNTEQIATCPSGSTGPPSIADAHTFPSTISQAHANSLALASAQSNLVCVVINTNIYYNVQQHVCCPTESRGLPPSDGCVTVAAGLFSSTVSQESADTAAFRFGQSQLSCIPVTPPPDTPCNYAMDPHDPTTLPAAFNSQTYGNVFIFYEYSCTPDPAIPLPMGGFATAFTAKQTYTMCKTSFSVFLDTEQPHEPFSKLKGEVFFRLYSDKMAADPLIPDSSFHYPNALLAESTHVRLEDIPNLAKSLNGPVGWTPFDMTYNLVKDTVYWVVIMSNLDPAVEDPTLNNWPAVYWMQDASLIGDDGYRVYLWACTDISSNPIWHVQSYNKDAGYPAMQTFTYSPVNPPHPSPSDP